MIIQKVLRRSRLRTLSLVAGHVTGGGGKATQQKPNGTMSFVLKHTVY